jgi:hypothetical protein
MKRLMILSAIFGLSACQYAPTPLVEDCAIRYHNCAAGNAKTEDYLTCRAFVDETCLPQKDYHKIVDGGAE